MSMKRNGKGKAARERGEDKQEILSVEGGKEASEN